MKALFLLTACALPLAACSKGPTVHETNASVEEVASKVRAATDGGQFIKPGEWKSDVKIEKFEMPGMPAEAGAHIQQAMAANRGHGFTTCLSPEDVKQPKGKFFTGNDQCRYDHFNMGGGKIDAAMRCAAGREGTQVMTMTGTYSPERYQMHMTMKGEGVQGPAAGMTMEMSVDSRRVGECSAKVANADR